MDKIGLNSNNINFRGIKISRKGAKRLSYEFQNKDADFLKKIISRTKKNISADVLVKDNEILVVPNKYINLAPMRMKDITNDSDLFRVDYLKYDIYDAFYNGYYTINQLMPDFPYSYRYDEIGKFGKLFEGACRIAENIDAKFHNKIADIIARKKAGGHC